MTTADIQRMICKSEVLKSNLACENVSHFLAWECDVLSLSKSGYLSEYEVKISRSDFQAEKKKVRKWNLIEARCEWTCPNYFWYVCPVGLIREDEVPIYAGLIYISDEGLLIMKTAPLLHRAKKDKMKVVVKFCRVAAERIYLGGCRMSYDNRRRKEFFEQKNHN